MKHFQTTGLDGTDVVSWPPTVISTDIISAHSASTSNQNVKKPNLLTYCEQCYLDAMLFQIQHLFFSLESFQIQRIVDCLLISFPVTDTAKRNEKPIMNNNYMLQENKVMQ
jgi:hypothetical protein